MNLKRHLKLVKGNMRVLPEIVDVYVEAIQQAVADVAPQVVHYRSYSGRNMYGKRCAAIVGPRDMAMRTMFKLAIMLSDIELELDPPSEDQMGRDVVYYWPLLELDLDDQPDPEDDDAGYGSR